ncbi:thioesterase II family protein [Streptomyces sulphureus]|uniref:thioesterase II family protein n=1 Tax=Streptomyces sulphureus TaxID=47758 RepID=UPI0003A38C26|nr:alpha/beta fold hydrolase [Streptomyces sulphureus]
MSTEPKPVLHAFPSHGASQLRMVCFPNAAGGIAQFHRWASRLPGVAVHAVELPGHGGKLGTPPLRDMNSVLAAVTPEIAELGPEPIVLWGHSMGATVAHAVARNLGEKYEITPHALLLAGRDAPWSSDFLPLFHTMNDADLWHSMVGFGGTPPEIADHADLLDLFLPVLRADLTVVEAYRTSAEPRLHCPVHVFTGRGDALVSSHGLAAWAEGTTEETRVHEFPGGHFFVHEDDGAPVLRVVRDLLLFPETAQ